MVVSTLWAYRHSFIDVHFITLCSSSFPLFLEYSFVAIVVAVVKFWSLSSFCPIVNRSSDMTCCCRHFVAVVVVVVTKCNFTLCDCYRSSFFHWCRHLTPWFAHYLFIYFLFPFNNIKWWAISTSMMTIVKVVVVVFDDDDEFRLATAIDIPTNIKYHRFL